MTNGNTSAKRRARRVSEAERSLWRTAMRDAVPLNGRAMEPVPPPVPAPLPVAPKPSAAPVPIPPAMPPRPVALPELTYARSPGLDRRSSERLKRGQLPIDARLDLHGMTQDAARAALDRFVVEGQRRGFRAVLVITGKGVRKLAEPEEVWGRPIIGILRREVPRWLNERPNREAVLAFTEAQPQHGGGGALYVLLRRQRG